MKEFCEIVVKIVEEKLKYQGEYKIELVDKPLMKDKIVIPENRSHIHVHCKRNEKHNIKVAINVDFDSNNPKTFSRLYSRGFSEYLEGLGIEENPYVNVVIVIIHEFGHLDMALEAVNYGCLNRLTNMTKVSKGLIQMLYDGEQESNIFFTGESINYKYDFSELYADNFVYRHFPYIWNQVKHLVEKNEIKKRPITDL